MRSNQVEPAAPVYSVVAPVAHSLHESIDADDFQARFEAWTGYSVQQVVDRVVSPDSPRAIFLTGSLPLGMATHGSDVDFVVMVDSRDALRPHRASANTNQELFFANESDPLRTGLFINVMNGVTVEVAAVITPAIRNVYKRLRSHGPELSETEIMVLARLRTGWLLGESEEYRKNSGIDLADPMLDVYCATRHFSFALIYRQKGTRALERSDIPQALHLGRLSVEGAYLAYFASEGMSYLGSKWLAQIGHARGAQERVRKHPLLQEGVPLLFPAFSPNPGDAAAYLRKVGEFLALMRELIEKRTLFRIAFRTCPQIDAIE